MYPLLATMNKNKSVSVCLPILFLLSASLVGGCSEKIGPSKAELVSSYDEILPKGSKVSSLDIEGSENLGTNTEPKIHTRFKAVLKVDITSLSEIEKEEVQKLKTDGKDFAKVHGIAISKRYGDEWDTDFKIEKAEELIQ